MECVRRNVAPEMTSGESETSWRLQEPFAQVGPLSSFSMIAALRRLAGQGRFTGRDCLIFPSRRVSRHGRNEGMLGLLISWVE